MTELRRRCEDLANDARKITDELRRLQRTHRSREILKGAVRAGEGIEGACRNLPRVSEILRRYSISDICNETRALVRELETARQSFQSLTERGFVYENDERDVKWLVPRAERLVKDAERLRGL